MQLTPSETVVLHPLRFVDPAIVGVRPMGSARTVSRPGLARLVAMAAVIANAADQRIVLKRSAIPVFGVLVGRRLRGSPGENAAEAWPEGSLEAAMLSIVSAAGGGLDVGTALRKVMLTGRRLRPDAIGFVEQGLRARGIHAPVDADADGVQRMLSDFREREPDMWVELRRQVDRALRLPLARQALLAGRNPDLARPRRRQDFLKGWRDLNRNPPSASKTKS